MNLSARSFEILHFSDSSFPTGGYGFSNGLESAWYLKILERDTFEEYLKNSLHNVIFGEIPYIESFMTCSMDQKKDWVFLNQHYGSTLLINSIEKSSLVLGQNWFRLLVYMYPQELGEFLNHYYANKLVKKHFLSVYSIALRKLNFEIKEAKFLYLYQYLRDQMSAAVRLGIVGSMKASLIQKKMYQFIFDKLEDVSEYTYERACKVSPVLEAAQEYHKKLYTRIFQN